MKLTAEQRAEIQIAADTFHKSEMRRLAELDAQIEKKGFMEAFNWGLLNQKAQKIATINALFIIAKCDPSELLNELNSLLAAVLHHKPQHSTSESSNLLHELQHQARKDALQRLDSECRFLPAIFRSSSRAFFE